MDWEKIEERLNVLIENGQHGQLRGALLMLNPADIALYMKDLPRERLVLLFRILPKDVSADVFSYMDAEEREMLVESINDAEVATLIDNMFVDDAVDFLEELPANAVRRVLQAASTKTRAVINQFLKYPENSAGSLMTIEYMEFEQNTTVGEAMEEIKHHGMDKETIYTLFIIDRERRLVGTVPLYKAITSEDDRLLIHLVDPGVISVVTTDDQEEVVRKVRHYDLMSIAVVDHENRLVGIITADDIMDVIEEETTEDIEKMSGLVPADETYLRTPIIKLVGARLPWLMILMITSIISGAIIAKFEAVLAVNILLSASIPMLMDTGGNSGQQASTLMVRGLALGEIQFSDFFKVLWKELRVGLLAGAALSSVTFLRLLLFNQAALPMALVIAFSLYVTVVLAKSFGCMLPLLANKIGLDPAVMASPLITTIVDGLSLTIYCTIAAKFLL